MSVADRGKAVDGHSRRTHLLGVVGLFALRARRLLALPRARRRARAGPRRLAAGHGGDPGARRGRLHRTRGRIADGAGLPRPALGRGGRRRQQRWHRAGSAAGGRRSARSAVDRHRRQRAAGRLDREIVGAPAGDRGGGSRRAAPAIFVADRCRHRARARHGGLAGGAGRARALRAHLADGEAALRQPGRAYATCRPLSISSRCCFRSPGWRTAQAKTAAAAGGCMLVDADALRAGRRHRQHPPRFDRRLLAGAAHEAPRSDLARPDRARAQPAAL